MGIIDIFSKRYKKNNNAAYKFFQIPNQLRVQIIHIWIDAIGRYDLGDYYSPETNQVWDSLHESLCKEYGVFSLSQKGQDNAGNCIYFLQEEKSVEKVLDIIELSFRLIDKVVRQNEYKWRQMGISQRPDDAIKELNQRFQEHKIGYQYIEGQIVRTDSDFLHKEAVEPAVKLLVSEGFEGALEEFMKAHEHFRKGNYKEAVTEAEKSFESVMKTICIKNKWTLPKKQSANPLIKTLIENSFIPAWLENSLLGLPTLRNNLTGHGQGEKIIQMPRHFVAYSLHLCATNIVYLIESYKSK